MLITVTVLAVFVNIVLGLFVLLKNPKSATHRLFFLLNIIIVFWSIANYFSLDFSYDANTLFWIRMVLFFAVPMTATFVLLIHVFPRDTFGISRRALYFYIFPIIVVMGVTLSPYVFTHLIYSNGNATPISGPLMPLFGITVVGSIAAGVALLIKKYLQSSGMLKHQLQYILMGTTAMFASILFTIFFPVVFFGNTIFVQFAPVYTYWFVGAVAYTIAKHRFLDIRLVVARSVAYTLLIFILGTMYAAGLFLTGALFIGTATTGGQLITSTILALLMAFSFQPLRRYLEKTTDKIFYKDHYDTQELLYNLTLIMASTLRMEDLTHQLLKKILEQMRITRGAFILIKEEHIYEVAHEGYTKAPEIDEKNVLTLLSQNKMLILEELPEGDIKNIMRALEFTVAIYLRTEGEQIGLLVLGEKLSGDIYTDEDVRVLEIFAPEAAVAIQNAQSYEEIRRFSITLQEEVDRATKELRDANEKLKALDKLKDEFISLAAHELRTPMTAIKSYLWMVLNREATLDEEKKKLYMDRVYNSTERLIKLVNDMLNVSRIESGRLQLTPANMDLVSLAREVSDELSAKVSERGLLLTIKEAKIPNIFADRDKIQEVLLNLIGNSIKFTEKGKIVVSFKLSNGMVETAVTDTGKGMSKEDIGKLFQKFGRLDNRLVAVGEAGGSGLGLYLCKQLVELSGGKIWVESPARHRLSSQATAGGEVGKGSTFTFSLPIAK